MSTYYEINYNLMKVYNSLNDNISKEVFNNRILMTATGNEQYCINMLSASLDVNIEFDVEKVQTDFKQTLIKDISDQSENKGIIVFGAGTYGNKLYNFLEDYLKDRVEYICDQNPRARIINAVANYISPEDLVNNPDKYNKHFILISVCRPVYRDEIFNLLISNNYHESYIYAKSLDLLNYHQEMFISAYPKIFSDLHKLQYFDSIIEFSDEEIFIDAGAFNLETTKQFIGKCKGRKKIIAFEPSTIQYKLCRDILIELKDSKYLANNDADIQLVNSGLYSSNCSLCFVEDCAGSTVIEANDAKYSEDSRIDVVSLDNFLDEKVTFIKMDIEGSELEALKGAKETIKKYKPKLAICIYHKHEDIYEIPLYIMSLVPNYKFYLRHYSIKSYETVLYAV